MSNRCECCITIKTNHYTTETVRNILCNVSLAIKLNAMFAIAVHSQ